MTLERRAVTRDTLWPLINLAVRDDQRDLVAPNIRTFAEVPHEPGGHVWGLWEGDTPVGLMAMVDPHGVGLHGPGTDPEAAYLWRLMIDARHQGRGHGGQAIAMAIASARAWGAPRLVVGVRDAPHGNRGFYERCGFRDAGVVEEGDRLFLLDLTVRAGTHPRE
jgi:diamine N-acetyltransferase